MTLFSKYPRNSHGCVDKRTGFTLVELLIVIAIMTILAGLSLAMVRSATQKAKVSRTESQIARINEYLQYRWDEYEVRILAYRINDPNRATLANVRKDAMLEMIRAEMPTDRDYIVGGGGTFPSTEFQAYYDSLGAPWNSVDNQLAQRRPSVFRRFVATAPAGWTDEHEQAECLYMVLQSIVMLDQSGIDHLHKNEVADTDGDGALEVLDAFGKPLQFVIQIRNVDADGNGVWDFDHDGDGLFEAYEDLDMDRLNTLGMYGGNVELTDLRFLVRSTRLDDSATREDPL